MRFEIAATGLALALFVGSPASSDQISAQTISIDAPSGISGPTQQGLPQIYKRPEFLRQNFAKMRFREVEYHPVPPAPNPRAYARATAHSTIVKPAIHLTLDAKSTTVFKDSESSVLEHLEGLTSRDKANFQYQVIGSAAEPSLAIGGKTILITANWSAFLSTNGGKTFTVLDPFALFGTHKEGDGFCCDQVAIFDAKRDMFVWLMQGNANTDGDTVRILVASSDEASKNTWHAYDLDPGLLGQGKWPHVWLDFPDLATSDQYLYFTTNLFPTDKRPHNDPGFPESIVARIALDDLKAIRATHIDLVALDESFAPRVAQGISSTAYWATHGSDSSKLRVFSWPESSMVVSYTTTTVDGWYDPYSTPANSTVGLDPKHRKPWLTRLDGRITAAWQLNGRLGFAWSASQDPANGYGQPYICVVTMDPANLGASVNQINIWSNYFAFAYPSIAPLPNGELGLSLAYGGGRRFPSTAVGRLVGDQSQPKSTWDLITGLVGLNAPACQHDDGSWYDCGFWGDYLTVRPYRTSGSDSADSWAVVGFAALNPAKSKSNEGQKMGISLIQFSHRSVHS